MLTFCKIRNKQTNKKILLTRITVKTLQFSKCSSIITVLGVVSPHTSWIAFWISVDLSRSLLASSRENCLMGYYLFCHKLLTSHWFILCVCGDDVYAIYCDTLLLTEKGKKKP